MGSANVCCLHRHFSSQRAQIEANVTCEEGDLLRHNTNCTPVCQAGWLLSMDNFALVDSS